MKSLDKKTAGKKSQGLTLFNSNNYSFSLSKEINSICKLKLKKKSLNWITP